MLSQAPSLADVASAIGCPALVLRTSEGIGAHVSGRRSLELLIPPDAAPRARAALEPLDWRYAWLLRGPLRLLPLDYFWWDTGDVGLFRDLPAAPLPASVLRRLRSVLWETSVERNGHREPDPDALFVHLAVQSCRSDPEAWEHLRACREHVDPARTLEVAREVRMVTPTRRALELCDAGSEAPPRVPFLDGAAGALARAALAVRRHARPRWFGRLLAGRPALGDFTLRCRVAGVELRSERGVFVPTPDAELFVEVAARALAGVARPVVLEVGTGCGAIALGLAHERPAALVHGSDRSTTAVRCARRNAARLGLERVGFHSGSLLDPYPASLRGSVDLVLGNLSFYPPASYAPIGAVPRDTIEGEGDDGLGLLRTLAREAPRYLRPEGILLLQMLATQWPTFAVELEALGYEAGESVTTGRFVLCPATLRPSGR